MPNLIWSELNHLQLGRYAEYYAKMEFTSYGFYVFSSEVDDHGVDFIVKTPDNSKYYEVQVKSSRNNSYIFIRKDKIRMDDSSLVVYLRFIDNKLPEFYVIPITEWNKPNAVLVDRNYDKPNQKSDPEWGINVSAKNMNILKQYEASVSIPNLL